MDEFGNTLMEFIRSPKVYVPIITICLGIIIIRTLGRVIRKLINKDATTIETKRRNTIVSLAENVIKYVIIGFAILIILATWGVDITGLIAGLGVAGVVAGLAIQDALKDIIMGCNIIMDNFFVVGDLVNYNGFTGEVIEFGLKSTKIMNPEGSVLVVSNREITNILNLSQKNASVAITIPVAYEESDEKVTKIIQNICNKIDSWDLSVKKTEFLGIDNLNSSSVDYLIKAYCKAGNQYTLKRKILSLVKKELDKNKIKIPYNQVEVHNG